MKISPPNPQRRERRQRVGHEFITAVEKLLPAERVIAGPFLVEHAKRPIALEEQQMAKRALLTQTDHGEAARLVMHQKRAFVVRPREGWQKQSKEGLPKKHKAAPQAGQVWASKELGKATVTSTTRTMVDFRLDDAKQGHRNKVAALGWFLKHFKREARA